MGRYFLHCVSFAMLLMVAMADDLNRQSIVFYDETPDVFYCPQEKPVSLQGAVQVIFNLICLQAPIVEKCPLNEIYHSIVHFYFRYDSEGQAT